MNSWRARQSGFRRRFLFPWPRWYEYPACDRHRAALRNRRLQNPISYLETRPNVNMCANYSSPYRTTAPSPLSPTMRPSPRSQSQTNPSGTSRRGAAPELRLPSIPGPFHPLVYESQSNSKTNSPSSSRPSSSRGPLSPTLQARSKSGATQKNMQQMQQYHREVLARAASTLMGPAPPTTDAPRAPHLAPHGSPGPATPLNLEEPKDYMSARSIGEGSPHAATDKYIREDQERRNSMRMERSSPAVSPRC